MLSGAMYCRVPTVSVWYDMLVIWPESLILLILVTRSYPKSPRMALKFAAMKMFSDLMSRWMTAGESVCM